MAEADNKRDPLWLRAATAGLVFLSAMAGAALSPTLTYRLGYQAEERIQDIENIKRFTDLVSLANGYSAAHISEPCIEHVIKKSNPEIVNGRFLGDICGVRPDFPGAAQLASIQLLANLGIRYPSYRHATITALEHLSTTLPLAGPSKQQNQDPYDKAARELLVNEAKRLVSRMKEYDRTHPDKEISELHP